MQQLRVEFRVHGLGVLALGGHDRAQRHPDRLALDDDDFPVPFKTQSLPAGK